ncbi:MAG TPA: hypothetical protein P5057_00505 [Acidobacteriota bacterium]|nr:hypothetical protein [Acidobacteriota bacterium]HRR55419.1 hypothetical protein [Acidobacteriota bacterium]
MVVGDRGLITSSRIREDLSAEEGIDWITALQAPQIAGLLDRVELPASLFDERDLAEITSAEFPGGRLVVCRNPFLADERARKREALLCATEAELSRIAQAVERPRRALRGKAKIGPQAGRVLHQFKMGKHFELDIGDDFFRFCPKLSPIRREAASRHGLYVVSTSVPAEQTTADQAVGSYQGLSLVERAFRCSKTVDLKLRPLYHRLPDRVRARVFLCMPAYYVAWHMRQSLAPILFDDDDRQAAARMRRSVVAPAERSSSVRLKARTRLTQEGLPVHSFSTLLADLATIVQNTVQPKLPGAGSFLKTTVPSPLQQRALDLFGGVRL